MKILISKSLLCSNDEGFFGYLHALVVLNNLFMLGWVWTTFHWVMFEWRW